ncbi:MAG: acyl-CoA dehydratase activase-related protein, partial [Anaerolineae bacterium]|nr:acyl-CoA dehydratase activase-related protein [Anaerolineae bacterium]
MKSEDLRMGVDVGSTTAKVVIVDRHAEIVFSAYQRHNAETLLTLQSMVEEAETELGDVQVDLLVTGSAGMGLSEKYTIPFIQEVIASAEVVNQLYPQVKTLIDIGGEDAKMIFFKDEGPPDIRMNGSCAGGTGAFIDEMANLLNIPIADMSTLADKHTRVYPIASRCGVFAKTDVQNLLSRETPWEDVAASIFNAVVLQTLATLSRGYDTMPMILFSGGPLTFLPALRKSFMDVLALENDDLLEADNLELLPAIGAALAGGVEKQNIKLSQLIRLLGDPPKQKSNIKNRLLPLFDDPQTFDQWHSTRMQQRIDRIDIGQLSGKNCFLGVDSGSTTTKVVLIDEQGKIAFDDYRNNGGNPIKAARLGLEKIGELFASLDPPPNIARSVVTGYGEDLIRTAYGFDEGLVETLAHFRAAKAFDKDVSFILDIGGQDMKAIFVNDGHIQNIEINEACSSGCGTFIQSFAKSMEYGVEDFATIACDSKEPCDLGTRCTVFMNSKVKQSLREGAEVKDIAAGLAYSVIKNALHKVLKIRDVSVLGENVIVQGGTFRNPAVHKAIEHLLDRKVLCPDIAELMGAYGAAMTARDVFQTSTLSNGQHKSVFVGFDDLEGVAEYTKKMIRCHGCENHCSVNKLIFPNKNVYYTGNRCERIYANSGKNDRKGINLPEIKYHLLFDRPTSPDSKPIMTVGIPRVLNLYETFPFWNTLLVECGIEVRLSDPSSNALYEKGVGTVMSENICFPAKVAHGHIFNLIEAEVDRIFYPMVFYEENQYKDAVNCYNCPIVSGYPDVIRSSIDPEGRYNIPFDMPAINFNDKKLLKRAVMLYLSGLGIDSRTIQRSLGRALEAQKKFADEVRALGTSIVDQAKEEDRKVILILGRPYQYDPMVIHKVPEILAAFGVDVISEDAIPIGPDASLNGKYASTQWAYSNRFFHAAHWVGQQDHVEVVQLNSFGCGPDASIVDNINTILSEYGKGQTVIRIDEIESTGSTKLRLRSMIELIERSERVDKKPSVFDKHVRVFQEKDRDKLLLVPQFSNFCSPPLTSTILDAGYKIEALPPSNNESVQVGLKYVHNETCYPGIIMIGDLIKALQSGKYDPEKVAIAFWETGGQCRATSYLSMLKRALIASNFEGVPIVTIATGGKAQNEQPGFDLTFKKFLSKAALTLIFTDSLSTLYHATAIRELHKGEALALAESYLGMVESGELPPDKDLFLQTIEKAVADFNAIHTDDRDYPVVGIVGEVYLKYNRFGNNQVAQWLMDHDIEVIIPPLMEFFSGWFVSIKTQVNSHLRHRDLLWLLSFAANKKVQNFLDDMDLIMQGFRYYRPGHTIQDIAKKAQRVVSLTHQYGEGWLIAGEIGALVAEGVKDVLCLQPFGCIANHIVAKGV